MPLPLPAINHEEFAIIDDDGNETTAHWMFEPTRPNPRYAGITGWALVNGEVVRLHVCAHSPC